VAEELVRLLPAQVTAVGFFNPYPAGLGGGEKYLYTILEEAVRTPGLDVTLLSPRPPATDSWRNLNVDVDPAAFRWRRAGPLTVTPRTRGLDLFVAIANHIPPLSLARRSVAIIQFPFADLGGPPRKLERRLRLSSYDEVLCYSQFVRQAIAERLRIADAVVLPPPVDTERAAPGVKGTSLIAVGRFFPSADANNKKHDVLIEALRRLSADPRAAGWELHMAGGCADDPGSRAYLEDLRRRAEGLPVSFHPNASPDTLARLYAGGALFWHAAGHGESRPERFEHFGITTVEAMAYGCIPIVPALGGQLEIVADRRNGRLWHSVDELVAITSELIADPGAAARLREAAVADAARYSRGRFLERVRAELLEF
jgi:glycosyltransferase involved in cell wall biosynthesis